MDLLFLMSFAFNGLCLVLLGAFVEYVYLYLPNCSMDSCISMSVMHVHPTDLGDPEHVEKCIYWIFPSNSLIAKTHTSASSHPHYCIWIAEIAIVALINP